MSSPLRSLSLFTLCLQYTALCVPFHANHPLDMFDIRHRWEFLSPDRSRRGFTASRQIESTRKTLIKRRLQVKYRKKSVEQKQSFCMCKHNCETQIWINGLLRINCELCALAIFVFFYSLSQFHLTLVTCADSSTAAAAHSHVMWRVSKHKKDDNEWEMIFPHAESEDGTQKQCFLYAFGCALAAAQRTQWRSWWRTRLILN